MANNDKLEKIFYNRASKKVKKITDKDGKIVGYIDKRGNYVNNKKEVIGYFAMDEKVDNKVGEEVKKTSFISSKGKYESLDSKLYENGKLIGFIGGIKNPKTHVGSNLGFVILTVLLASSIVGGTVINDTLKNEVPQISITDGNIGLWEEETKIKVFDDIIYPGSQGKYEFVVKNDSLQKLEYTVNITQFYNDKECEDFPMVYRLKKEYRYLTGIHWVDASDLKFDNLLLSKDNKQTFVLEWMWPYEGESDEKDTLLGFDPSEYYISISVNAEIYNGD